MGEIWGLILAAGESKRMGFPKMHLPFNGKPMLENVIVNVTGSDIDYTMVVLGADREILVELVEKSSVKHCYNYNYKEGMLSSVKCGFRNLPPDFEAVLIFQGDQPLITPNVINTIIEAYRSSGKGIVVPVYEKKRGHPLLIDRKFRDKIEKLDTREGLRSLAYQFSDDVLEVETDDSGILRDIDTYEEYKNEINQIQ
ncbi:MAG: nucleotidyltransferase family protein [Bacteroidia bacterium]|nr:nucleotidyltransferase family protein [Bacteroidia bacterium]